MPQTTIHNPDRFMADLRQIISQGRKRIGFLIGAGAPVSLKINDEDKLDDNGQPLIPDVERLTQDVEMNLEERDKTVVDALKRELGKNPNIESILTRIRQLSQAIGNSMVHNLNGVGYEEMAGRICDIIGGFVAKPLPNGCGPHIAKVKFSIVKLRWLPDCRSRCLPRPLLAMPNRIGPTLSMP